MDATSHAWQPLSRTGRNELSSILRELSSRNAESLDLAVPSDGMAESSDAPRSGYSAWWILALAVMAVVAFTSVARPHTDGETIPAQIVGTWTTSAPGYADRAFKVTRTVIAFYRGDLNPVIHQIRGVHRVRDGNGSLITIDYANGGNTYALSLYSLPDGTIRLKNQQQLQWTRGKVTQAWPDPATQSSEKPSAEGELSPLPTPLLSCIKYATAQTHLVGFRKCM